MMKKILTLTLILSMVLMPLHRTSASVWGESIEGQLLDNVLETIRAEIIKAINSSMKMMAINQATSMIETVLYGGSSSPRNIKNFRKFLFEDTRDTAITYGETFLTDALRGTSSGDYSASGGGSLTADIKKSGENSIAQWKGSKKATVDFASACSGDAIVEKDYSCLAKVISNPLNSPIGMAIAVDATIAAKEDREIAAQQLEATASGSLPDKDKETGDVKLPLAVVMETQLQRITMPLTALANAESGVFSSVIQAFVVGLVVGVVQKGLSEVEAAVDDAVQSFEDAYVEEMGPVYDALGPAADFAQDAYDMGQKVEAMSEAQRAANEAQAEADSALDNDYYVDDSSSQMDNSADADNPTQPDNSATNATNAATDNDSQVDNSSSQMDNSVLDN